MTINSKFDTGIKLYRRAHSHYDAIYSKAEFPRKSPSDPKEIALADKEPLEPVVATVTPKIVVTRPFTKPKTFAGADVISGNIIDPT